MGEGSIGSAKAFPRNLRKLIVAFLLGANLFILAISGYSLYLSRQQNELRARALTENMAAAIDQSLSHSIEKIDLALQAIADELERQIAGKELDERQIGTILAKYRQRLPEVEGIRVADAQGLVLFGKGVNPKEPVSWADRDYFIYLREHPDAGLHVAKPRMGRVAKQHIVGFARRYNHADGSFAGVVSAPIALDYFAALLSRFNVGPQGALVLRDADLGLLARYPAVAGPGGQVGSSAVSDELRQLVQSGLPLATYYARVASDRVERIITFRRIAMAPMMVLVGVARDDYLAEWDIEFSRTAAGIAGFALLSLLSGWLVLYLLNRLVRENARNRLYLQHASDGIHILDAGGKVVQASDRFCAMLGYGRDEAMGMNVSQWDVRWPAETLLREKLPELLRLESSLAFETRHRRKDGEIIDVEVNVASFELDGEKYLYASSRDIGEKKRQQQALQESEARLRQSEERYRLLLKNSPVGILHYDPNLVVTYANGRFEEIMRLPRGHMAGLDCKKLDDQAVVPAMRHAMAGIVAHYEGPYATSFGARDLWISMACAPVMNEQGEILGGMAIVEDITARKRAESGLCLAASVFTHAHEGIMICDAAQQILDVNPTFSEITGYGREEIIGRTPKVLSSGRQDGDFYRAMWQAIESQGHWEGEVWNRRQDGSAYVQRLTISSVRDAKGCVTHYIGTFSDISLLKKHQAELEHLAHYDALTQLPNRALLSDRMAQALAQSRRSATLVAVCYLDLDGFKAINDELGHDAGDDLLVEVARRLKEMLRAGDTVARLGGDEFVLLLVGIDSVEECEQAALRILRALAAPFRVQGRERCISGSLGITPFPQDDSDPDTLLRHADQAMYCAKEAGKNRYQLFDASQGHRARNRHEIFGRLRQALDNGEFRLHYQPIVDMRKGTVLAFEGLIRWLHPERGLLLPDDFLPAAAGSELDSAIGRWVLAEGLRQLVRWRGLGLPQKLCLNISATHLLSPAFADELEALLAAHPLLEPYALEIEIVETTALEDLDATIAVFRRCHAAGVAIALDDFGTGHSSLSFFRRLPVDTLKIDQVFVQSVLDGAEDLAIVESVVSLTRAFDRKLVAEGVESVEIGMLLLHMGCNVGQGHGIARPMPAEDVPAWTVAFVPDRHWSFPAHQFGREDIPLFLAELDHRSWVRRLGAWLAADPDVPSPPPLDGSLCRFGQWYRGAGQSRYGRFAAFPAIGEIHDAVHRLGRELAQLCSDGRRAEARARFGELAGLRDRLIEQLANLQAENVLERI